MGFTNTEEAVSPAISTILMIAVVVVLAAIVGSVAFGTVGTQGNGQSVGITAAKGTSGIVFTIQGGADLRSVTAIDLIADNSIINCTGASPKVGDSCLVGTDRNGRTVMVATFADGSKQIVFDRNWGINGLRVNRYIYLTLTRSGTEIYYSYAAGPDFSEVSRYEFYQDGVDLGSLTPADFISYGPGTIDLYPATANPSERWTVYAIMPDESSVLVYDQMI